MSVFFALHTDGRRAQRRKKILRKILAASAHALFVLQWRPIQRAAPPAPCRVIKAELGSLPAQEIFLSTSVGGS